MKCNCIYSKVCDKQPAIINAFGRIIKPTPTTLSPAYKEVQALIEKVCKFKKQETIEYDEKIPNKKCDFGYPLGSNMCSLSEYNICGRDNNETHTACKALFDLHNNTSRKHNVKFDSDNP